MILLLILLLLILNLITFHCTPSHNTTTHNTTSHHTTTSRFNEDGEDNADGLATREELNRKIDSLEAELVSKGYREKALQVCACVCVYVDVYVYVCVHSLCVVC